MNESTTLLSHAQIEAFRTQARVKREALFLVPQLIEHVAILTEHLREAIHRIELIRVAVHAQARSLQREGNDAHPCTSCDDAKARSMLRRLSLLVEVEADLEPRREVAPRRSTED